MNMPKELSTMFKVEDFANYPFVKIPQFFEDDRGSIANIADGHLGDVAVITCEKGAVRANHVHKEDWHLSYLLQGSMNYIWKDENSVEKSVIVKSGQMVYSPPGVPHKMVFQEKSIFIAVAAKTRSSENYEEDTKRLSLDFFQNS